MDFQEFKKFVLNEPLQESQESEYYKVIADRYPFLMPTGYTGNIYDDYDFTWLNGFWHTGWTELFVTYCEKIKPEFGKLLDEFRKKIGSEKTGSPDIKELNELRKNGLPFIMDVKEKYGTCRVDWSAETEKMREDTFILDMLSSVTCFKCGKTPKTSKGHHVIWETRGYIMNYCKDHLQSSWTRNEPLKKSERKKFKEYCNRCKIESPRFLISSSYSSTEGHLKKFWKDTSDGWLEVDHIISVKR